MPAEAVRRISSRLLKISLALLVAASIGGCARDKMTTGSTGRSGKAVETMSAGELQSAARSLGEAYASNPKDKQTALRYASVLQMNGDTGQSLAVMRKLAI